MKIIDRLLRTCGLMRLSQLGYDSIAIEWRAGFPVFVDIQMSRGGQRVCGHVDPWWPNAAPDLSSATNPFTPERTN